MPVTMLMYHVIAAPKNAAEARFCRTPDAFRKDLEQIRQADYQVLPFSSVLEGTAGKVELPDKAVTITFDDGIACAYENALPILQEFDYPASVFVVTSQIDNYNDWGEAFGFPRRRMLTTSEIRTLDESGVDIGSHTANHLWLGKTEEAIVSKEVQDSKATLEDILGKEVPHFAYPFGSWSPIARDAVIAAGYTGACSTISGKNQKDSDPYLLRRSEIKGSDSPWQFRMKLRFATNDMPPISDARRILRQVLNKWKK